MSNIRISIERDAVLLREVPAPSKQLELNVEHLTTSTTNDLPAIDTSFQAWSFVVGSVLLEFLVWGYGYAFGVLQEYYTSDQSTFQHSSSLAISSIGTIGVGLQYILGIFFEPLYKAYPRWIKTSMWVSLCVTSGGFLLSSWATQVWHLIILQGLVYGFAGAALYFPVIVWLSEWFFHRRSTAAGIIFGGSSAGGVIFPFLFRGLLDKLGYPNAMRTWAGIFFALGAVAIPLIKPRISVSATSRAQYPPRSLQVPDFSFMRTSKFLFFAVTVMAQRLAYTPITFLLSSYTRSFDGVTAFQSTLALVTLNFSGMLGYMVSGYCSDRIAYWKVMVASGAASALTAALLLGFAQSFGAICGFGVLFGMSGGGYASVWTAAAKDIREEHSGTVFLTFSVFSGMATVIGPLIAGALQTAPEATSFYGTHGFRDVVFWITGMLTAVTLIGGLFGYRIKHKSLGPEILQSWT